MDDVQKMQMRAQCLDLAVQVCKMASDSYGVVSKAEEYWKWLTKENTSADAPIQSKNTDDDMPF